MQNWDDLRFVLALHRHKTMSRAAESLGTNIATVSRRIERVTAAMDEALFMKMDNTWQPTPLCLQLVEVARLTEGKLSGVESNAEKEPEPGSVIRLNSDITLLQIAITAEVPKFLEENPGINLDLSFRRRSLAYAETDIAVGYKEPLEGRIVRRKVGAITLRPFALGRYAGQIEGWLQVDYATNRSDINQGLERNFGKTPRLILEGVNIALQFMRAGPWCALLPERAAAMEPDLVELDIPDCEVALEIWSSYHSSRKLDPVVRLGIEFVERCFSRL